MTPKFYAYTVKDRRESSRFERRSARTGAAKVSAAAGPFFRRKSDGRHGVASHVNMSRVRLAAALEGDMRRATSALQNATEGLLPAADGDWAAVAKHAALPRKIEQAAAKMREALDSPKPAPLAPERTVTTEES